MVDDVTPTRDSPLRAPLDEALGDQLRELDVALARAYQILAVAGMFGGALVGYVLALPQGYAMVGLSALGLAWFRVQERWLPGPRGALAQRIGVAFEAAMPPIFLVAVGLTQGAEYALGSFVSPMLYACVLLASTARLRPVAPLVIGASSGVAFLAIYFLWLRGALSPESTELPLFRPPMQISRSIAFLTGGALAFLVTKALRRAIGRAERKVRADDLFGKYRLGVRIGAGGMGAVHEAIYCPEGGFERRVAIKLLHPHLADQKSFVVAFRAEAELSARLVHPNIVQTLDFGRAGDAYFLVLEHVRGLTMAAWMRRLATRKIKLRPDVVAWIGEEILAGLEYAHAGARDTNGQPLRIVHRDLCPANVLLSINGDVKVSDFGVAKALGDASLVEATSIAGHAGYMAPEQLAAEPLDERCDLFAAGVVLWELFAGEPLFRRGSEAATLLAVVEASPRSIRSIRPDLAEGWDGFFSTALARHRAERFGSAAEMRAALGALRTDARPRREEVAELVELALSVIDDEHGAAKQPGHTEKTEVDRARVYL
ncbi:MAG: serine/threonine protein kinase [Myxococcales bacterium]|nr:serine/threonine protein kinase [Myxococcales bacterium]